MMDSLYFTQAILPRTSSKVIILAYSGTCLEAYFKINKNSGEQEKESIIQVKVG